MQELQVAISIKPNLNQISLAIERNADAISAMGSTVFFHPDGKHIIKTDIEINLKFRNTFNENWKYIQGLNLKISDKLPCGLNERMVLK